MQAQALAGHPVPENYFAQLSAINVNGHVEKKGGFSYLSWPYAVAQLRLADPSATWEVRRVGGLPDLAPDSGVVVEVAVTVHGVCLSQIHPVLDGRSRPLLAPSAFDINTSIQRALVKAIALHGLGLSIYAGEDLPDLHEVTEPNEPKPSANLQAKSVSPTPSKVTNLPGRGQTPRGGGAEWLTDAQLRFVKTLISETQTDVDELLAYFGFETLDTIPKAEVNRVIRALESKRRAA